MFIRNNTRFNIYSTQVINGVRYADFTSPAARKLLGISEVAEPASPADYSDETYYRQEQQESPFVVYTRKSDEQLAQLLQSKRDAMVVSRFQARAALHLAGYLARIEAYMALETTDMLVKLAWQDASEFRRSSPTLLALAALLEMDDEKLDKLFATAKEILA